MQNIDWIDCHSFQKMPNSETEAYAKNVVQYHLNVAHEDFKNTWNHFKSEGKRYQIIARIIKRYYQNGTADYQYPKTRKKKVTTPQNVEKVKKIYRKNAATSVRSGSKMVGISKSSFGRIKLNILGLRGYRKESAPKYKGNQKMRVKRGCRKIYRNYARNRVIIMDDETYVPIDPSQIPSKEYYHATTRTNVEDKFRYKTKEKFLQKYLVWQSIDEEGHVSEPFISSGSINSRTYVNECLKKRLVPFIKKYHKIENILFWTDMATSHYSKEVVEWLTNNSIEFVPRVDNAPNVPQARSIELFWAICKKEYSRLKNTPNGRRGFSIQWKKI